MSGRYQLGLGALYAGHRVVGVLGIIGPTRMAYESGIPLVDLTANCWFCLERPVISPATHVTYFERQSWPNHFEVKSLVECETKSRLGHDFLRI